MGVYDGGMGKQWAKVVGIGALVVVVSACYVFGIGSNWVEQIVVERQLSARGWGAVIPNKDQATMIVTSDGGSGLQKYGLKYAYVDSVYYEGEWHWGVARPNDWLIFQLFDVRLVIA